MEEQPATKVQKKESDTILGKRKLPPQKATAMLELRESANGEDVGLTSESRHWSHEDIENQSNNMHKTSFLEDRGSSGLEKDLLLKNNLIESELYKQEGVNNLHAHKYNHSKSMTVHATNSVRKALDIKMVNDFLRLLIVNHQRTVKQLAKNPEAKNPARSFDTYLRHLKLVKRISEHIWDKPDWYTAAMITESKVMKGLWMFVSYCETYREDCTLMNRAHVLLFLII